MTSQDTGASSSSSSDGGAPAGRRKSFGRFGAKKKLVEPEEPLDYKNVGYLSKFLSPNGRIQGRKRTGFSGQNQRKLATAIKRSRIVGLLPFVGRM
ncbi:MAG: small subunit ribosomal protein S18 [Planctomycetota bacterium]|jgi:small subunit ribosomal protein S18